MGLQASIVNGVWYGEPFAQPMYVTGEFGEPRNNSVGFHTGIDLAPLDGMPGQPIAFTTKGFFIKWVGVYLGDRARDVNGGYGNVLLGHIGDGYTVLLAHGQRFSEDILHWLGSGYDPNLKPTFSPGEVIMFQGNTGYVYGILPDGNVGIPASDDNVSGTHTHFEIRGPSGNLMNPRDFLNV
jgi:murein DD-endopeptidase MepM/ murein hydrolase activator NlpD